METQEREAKPNGKDPALTQNGGDWWTVAEQQQAKIKDAIKSVYAPKATEEQFLVFWEECKRRRAIPGRHIHFRLQRQKEKYYDEGLQGWSDRWTEKPIFITSIDFFRLTAHRTGLYAGQRPLAWYYLDEKGDPSVRMERIPHPQMNPYAAEATVLRKDFNEPLTRTARWSAFVQTYKDRQKNDVPNQMWTRMGPEQLAKCAEAQALRAAFPEELGGLYLSEEFQDDSDPQAAAQPEGAGAIPPAPALPPGPVNAAPAQVVDEKKSAPVTAADVQAKFGGTLESSTESEQPSEKPPVQTSLIGSAADGKDADPAAGRPKGRDGAKWYLRNVLEPQRMNSAGDKMHDYIKRCAGVSDTKKITAAQWEVLLAVLDARLRKDGPAAVVALIEGSAK